MACWITNGCIACGICIGRCPNDAVYVDAQDHYAIDPDKCTECIDLPKRRCLAICTVGAIQPDPNHAETREQLWAKHRARHTFTLDDLDL